MDSNKKNNSMNKYNVHNRFNKCHKIYNNWKIKNHQINNNNYKKAKRKWNLKKLKNYWKSSMKKKDFCICIQMVYKLSAKLNKF